MPGTDQFQVGDLVNVPGGMYGTVKYIGSVAGKPGRFAGIELASEHVERGKNSGDVDGRRYFRTNIPGSGIFVPINANRYITKRIGAESLTPSRSATVSFSKSVGPGTPMVRPPRLRQPSLPNERTSPSFGTPPPPTRSATGLRTPSVGPRSVAPSPIGSLRSRSPTKTTTPRPMARPPSRGSGDPGTPTSMRMGDFSRGPGASEFQALQDEVRGLQKQLVERDDQLNGQAAALSEFQRIVEELEGGPDVLPMRTQLREKNDKLFQLTAEFDNHRADFRSILDTLETAAKETERVYEQRIEELVEQNREMMDHGDDVELVAGQLKQLEELVSELEEGLEDARRGEAEARAENEFLRGEVERTKLELEKEREDSATVLRDTETTAATTDGRHQSRQLTQKDDEVRGLKAIITSLSRGEMLQNGSHERDRHVAQLESRVQDSERESESKTRQISELEQELRQFHLREFDRRPSAGSLPSPRKARAAHKASEDADVNQNFSLSQYHHLSDQTVKPPKRWDSEEAGIPRSSAAAAAGNRPEPPKSDDDGALFCELCERPGHDILNCTSMFGSGSAGTANNPTNKIRSNVGDTNVSNRDNANGNGNGNGSNGTGSGIGHIGGIAGTASTAAGRKNGRDGGLGGIRGIGGLLNPMAPAAGKTSGVIDESKWCALCERDGHESIDCPLDE